MALARRSLGGLYGTLFARRVPLSATMATTSPVVHAAATGGNVARDGRPGRPRGTYGLVKRSQRRGASGARQSLLRAHSLAAINH